MVHRDFHHVENYFVVVPVILPSFWTFSSAFKVLSSPVASALVSVTAKVLIIVNIFVLQQFIWTILTLPSFDRRSRHSRQAVFKTGNRAARSRFINSSFRELVKSFARVSVLIVTEKNGRRYILSVKPVGVFRV